MPAERLLDECIPPTHKLNPGDELQFAGWSSHTVQIKEETVDEAATRSLDSEHNSQVLGFTKWASESQEGAGIGEEKSKNCLCLSSHGLFIFFPVFLCKAEENFGFHLFACSPIVLANHGRLVRAP